MNLVPRLIQIYWIWWWCSLSCFRPEISYLGKFDKKNPNCLFKMKIRISIIRICWIRWQCSFVLLWTGKILFVQIWFQKITNFCSRWKLVPRVIPLAQCGGDVHLSCLGWEMHFLGKFGPKNQNCLSRIKFGIKTDLNMLNSMVM